MDTLTDMTKQTDAFRNFSNATGVSGNGAGKTKAGGYWWTACTNDVENVVQLESMLKFHRNFLGSQPQLRAQQAICKVTTGLLHHCWEGEENYITTKQKLWNICPMSQHKPPRTIHWWFLDGVFGDNPGLWPTHSLELAPCDLYL
jgi:hypothetical protein